jgi:glutamate N-acetyltransferase/amino-acid N-acetyltransferase
MADLHLARGYRFAGVPCDIRGDGGDRGDLALIVSDAPAAAAGVFTQNRVVAAPVQVCRQRLPTNSARGVVVCSGNANACTGERGLADAERMTALAAEQVGCRPDQMLVCSTGVIGRYLPMDRIAAGIPKAARALTGTTVAFDAAAHAILTTDTRIKVSSRLLALSRGEVRVTGFAKGAAMIGPNLATMLAFLVTDAPVEPGDLQHVLRTAAAASFNCISVEGHTSTNDTVLLFANGSGPPLAGDDRHRYDSAVREVCTDLARAIAGDAEGAKHLVTIEVEGLASDEDARRVAKAVADSALVKTAIYGADPNWGRIVSAAGYAGVPFEERQASLWLGDLPLYRDGAPLPFDAATASAYLKQNCDVTLRLRFTLGTGRCTFWTCDLTPEYVRLNADYTT